MNRLLACSLLLPLLCLATADAGKKKADGDDPKEALQALQEFIGNWKSAGNEANWSWRFKAKDVFLSVDLKDGKIAKQGEVRFLPDKGKYQYSVTEKKGPKQVFEGELKKGILTLERVNTETQATEQVKLNTAGGGDRLVYTFSTRREGTKLFFKQAQIGYTKEGVTFGVAGGDKKPECVVTGGLGTSTVSYMGATYYVCCTGCRDAFNDNPAKIIAEYKAKKKAGN